MTALAGTSLVFLCFSGAALLSKRRSYLYLGGEAGPMGGRLEQPAAHIAEHFCSGLLWCWA